MSDKLLQFGAAHPSDPASVIIRRLRRRCLSISRVFSIEYRISSEGNTNPFPAPLLDALAGYAYLVNTLKFLPENIVFAGDSAGGNLALTLVRYILDHAHEADFPLHPPKALVLFSPWADISDSHYPLISPAQIRADYLELPTPSDEGWLTHAGRMYAGQISLEEIRTNPYFSSASLCIPPDQARGLFKGFPKTFISCGGAELFKTHLVTLRDRMVMDAEQEGWVTFDEVEGAVHGFPGFEWQDPEGSEALARAARWIDGL